MGAQDYDILPAAVGQVLAQVGADGNQLIRYYEQLEDPLRTAGHGCGGSGLITAALGEVVQWMQGTLLTARNQLQRCLEGATSATNAYVTGDSEMAHEYGTTVGTDQQPTAFFPNVPDRPGRDNGPRDTRNERRKPK